MKWWHGVLIGGLGVAVYKGVIEKPDFTAQKCIAVRDDRNWSFRNFTNICDKPINVRFCDKSQLGEIAKAFGMQNVGDWRCRTTAHKAGASITTFKWVNDQSSVASHALASSVYNIMACLAPYTPSPTDQGKFTCRK